MRTCCQCGASFAPTGKGYRCPPCRKIYDQNWRANRKAEGKPVSGTRMSREYHQGYEVLYRQQPDVKERLRQRAKDRRNNPDERHKHVARWQVNRAVASGRLTKLPCVVCASAKSQGHHEDYSRPLDVVWLCAKHHSQEHSKAEGRSNV